MTDNQPCPDCGSNECMWNPAVEWLIPAPRHEQHVECLRRQLAQRDERIAELELAHLTDTGQDRQQ